MLHEKLCQSSCKVLQLTLFSLATPLRAFALHQPRVEEDFPQLDPDNSKANLEGKQVYSLMRSRATRQAFRFQYRTSRANLYHDRLALLKSKRLVTVCRGQIMTWCPSSGPVLFDDGIGGASRSRKLADMHVWLSGRHRATPESPEDSCCATYFGRVASWHSSTVSLTLTSSSPPTHLRVCAAGKSLRAKS